MTRLGWLLAGVVGMVVILGIAGFAMLHMRTKVIPQTVTVATSTPVTDPSALSIYTSGEYGFSFIYSSSALISDSFSSTSNAKNSWRAHGTDTGIPVVEVSDGQNNLRIGVSNVAKDIEACVKPGPSESTARNESIGTIVWNVFTSEKLGTDTEQKVTSYRIVHDSRCYALETFEAFSQKPAPEGYTGKDSITSFTFAH